MKAAVNAVLDRALLWGKPPLEWWTLSDGRWNKWGGLRLKPSIIRVGFMIIARVTLLKLETLWKEFNGVLSKPLQLVSYHNGKAVGDKRSLKLWMSVDQANALATMESFADKLAVLKKFGEKTHVSYAEIPTGEYVKFMHGRARFQNDDITLEFRQGGGVQYCFEKFDTAWIKASLPLQK